MKSHHVTISALALLALAAAGFGTLGHFYKANVAILTNTGGTSAARGYAILVSNGDLTIACEAYKRAPY